MAIVEVPPRYRGPTGGQSRVDVDGGTVAECIDAVEALHPGFRELVLDAQGEIRRYVKIFLNEEPIANEALGTAVGVEDRVQILASYAGG